jgi:hypothetical protein
MSQLDYNIPTHDYFFEYCERGGDLAVAKTYMRDLLEIIESGKTDGIKAEVMVKLVNEWLKEQDEKNKS